MEIKGGSFLADFSCNDIIHTMIKIMLYLDRFAHT